jgi:iron complex outermembrane receptor protein
MRVALSKTSRWAMSTCCILGNLLLLAGTANAQAGPPTQPGTPPVPDQDQPRTDDIVVTAQKRSQNIQDVPLAISALGSEGIKAIGHQDVTALVTRVPGLQVQQFSPTTVAFNIRGVSQNDFADSQEAPIAFYNDEVYVSAMSAISGQSYDLERIEVLRGPQGTLFGRNATGGLVQYITAKPTSTLQGFATLTAGSFGEVGTEAAISGPLSARVRARLSFSSDDYGGYIRNRIGPDIGSRHFLAGRAQIEADIGSQGLLRIKLQGMRNHNETSAPYTWLAATPDADGLGTPNPGATDFAGYKEPDNNPYTASFDTVPRFNRTYWSATARYEQGLGGGVELTSITDYQRIRKDYGEDSDGSPNDLFNYYQNQRLSQISQELRLSGKSDRLTWVAGLYGLIVDSNAHATIVAPAFGTTLTAGGPQHTASFAIFGQADYKLTDQLTVTLGARYSYDRKRDDYTHVLNGVTDLVFNPSVSGLAVQRYRNWSGKASLEYRPASGIMFYAGVNRGTKSGGFDIPNFPATDSSGNYIPNIFETIPYKQEVLTNYEGGFKFSLLDRKLDFNGSVFHYDYKNYQAFIIQGLTAVINNLPAKVTGFELEMTVRPAEGLNLGAFVTYLDTRIEDVTLPSGRVVNRVMPQAPKWAVGWNASYKTALGRGWATISTDWRYDGSSYFSTFNAPIDLEPGHTIGNARINYTLDHWTGAFFVNNVTGKRYRVYDLDNSLSLGSAQATYTRPRWFGGTLTYKF